MTAILRKSEYSMMNKARRHENLRSEFSISRPRPLMPPTLVALLPLAAPAVCISLQAQRPPVWSSPRCSKGEMHRVKTYISVYIHYIRA